jgi:hypothetical protein
MFHIYKWLEHSFLSRFSLSFKQAGGRLLNDDIRVRECTLGPGKRGRSRLNMAEAAYLIEFDHLCVFLQHLLLELKILPVLHLTQLFFQTGGRLGL